MSRLGSVASTPARWPLDEVLAGAAASGAVVERIDAGERGPVFLQVEIDGVRRWQRLDGDTVIEISPWCDRKVPLGAALAPEERARARVLAYRPERRLVVDVERGGKRWIEKGYRLGRAEHAARSHQRAASALAASDLRVAPLVEVREVTASLVLERVSGREPRLAAAAAGVFALLGRGLRVLQDSTGDVEAASLWSAADEIAVLDRWRERSMRVRGGLPEGWDEERGRCARAMEALPPTAIGLAHRDLHDRQLLVDAGRVTLLDFDLLCHAEVALDPGNLLAHLRLRLLQRARGIDGAAERLSNTFLAGLGRAGDPAFESRLPCYEASSLLRLALVYSLRPRWEGLAPELVACAKRSLDACG